MFERMLLGFFCKKTMWFVRIGIIAGAIGCVIYGSYVPTHIENWEWIDLCNMPGFWIWAIGFLRLGVPYLIFAHIIRFLVPNIDEQYEACLEGKMSLLDYFSFLLVNPYIWALFHPVKDDYARQYYWGRTAPYHESILEICHRIKVEKFRKYCEKYDLGFCFSEADREIAREENRQSFERTEYYSKELQKNKLAKGDYYGWNAWRDNPGSNHKTRPFECLSDKLNRVQKNGTVEKVQKDSNYSSYIYGKPNKDELIYLRNLPEGVFKEMSDEEFARYYVRSRFLTENA